MTSRSERIFPSWDMDNDFLIVSVPSAPLADATRDL
jgi:hypothetical protein